MEARIVVVDSDERMRELLTFCLERQGSQVWSYAYERINLTTLIQDKPNLIILNFTVEGEGAGWELLQLLKMETETAKIPIMITTTAFQLAGEVRNYLLTRYINVLQMPFDLVTFATLVQTTLTLASQANTLFFTKHSLPVLVVDDSEDIRENISMFLELESYPVATAHNGLEALEAVSRTNHSLILLDISMPIMTGLEFLRAYDLQLRPHTPVVIVSAETGTLLPPLPAFVVDRLPKPFEFKALLKVVEQYAQRIS